MIHPALDDLRPYVCNQPGEAIEPGDDAAGRGEVELDHRHACRPQVLRVGLAAQQADDDDLVGERWTRGREPGEHSLRAAADEQIGRDEKDLPRPTAHAHLSRQACSISTVHSGYCQLRVPVEMLLPGAAHRLDPHEVRRT